MHIPQSVAVPFRSFETLLAASPALEAQFNILASEANLTGLSDLVMSLTLPSEIKEAIMPVVSSLGSLDWGTVEQNVKLVWASKFNTRAYQAT